EGAQDDRLRRGRASHRCSVRVDMAGAAWPFGRVLLRARRYSPHACSRFTSLMPAIRIYTTGWCGLCLQAKALLERRGLPFEEIPLDDDPAFRQTVFDLGGRWT